MNSVPPNTLVFGQLSAQAVVFQIKKITKQVQFVAIVFHGKFATCHKLNITLAACDSHPGAAIHRVMIREGHRA
ncbi:MAG: hypothetical protein MK236_02525 [Pedosphaera sp.]|nr:hypothetical protein [Pedosphaera sp.]